MYIIFSVLQNWLLKKSDKIIATSPKYIEESKYLNLYRDKCISIPIGIEKLDDKGTPIPDILKKNQNKKIVFSLGRLVYYKGFEYLIKSAKYLDDSYVIMIGGEGKLKSSLVDLIKKEQLENRVFLLGKIDEDNIYHYYNNCKIFVLPSTHKSEAFGIVQIEAMSFGKPIVSTEIKGSGVDWVNENNESGLVVNIKDSKQISEAILEICTDEETYRTYSKKSLHRYNSFFTLNSMVKNIEQTYNSLMGI